jgi:hypothetical protein
MSYAEDVRTAARYEKLRVLLIVVAVTLFGVAVVFDLPWLHWPRAAAWILAGVAAIVEARAYKRLGRDPDATYLRAALCIVVGVFAVL